MANGPFTRRRLTQDIAELRQLMSDGDASRQFLFGRRVERDSAALPQSAAAPIFTITGTVALLGIVGRVTTAIQNQTNNTKLVGNPTTGTDVDICAVLNIANDEVGTLYGITGLFSDALVGANAGAGVLQHRPVVLQDGTLDLSCSASNTGAVKWTLFYAPLTDGATVVAA
jgi:hypothetical protein